MSPLPTIQQLFGDIPFCVCEECRSVYSPAAYLVDMLHALVKPMISASGRSGTDLLFDRRKDIGILQLTCANTNTPLPYIDLVNEILENAIAPATAVPQDTTTGTSAELAANPEHVNAGAYVTLAKAMYPWNLPFTLPATEARVYLRQMNVRRAELMQAYRVRPAVEPLANNEVAVLDDPSIAAEALGMTPLERQIVTKAINPWPDPASFWGLSGDPNWVTTVDVVEVFLRQSGLTYDELVQLVTTRFIGRRGGNYPPLDIASETGNCDVQELTITNLTADHLDWIHRFVRLRRKLGWSTVDLDHAIHAFGAADLTDALLVQLWHVERLRAELNVPLVRILAWWSDLDTDGDGVRSPSLYDQLFLSKSVIGPSDNSERTLFASLVTTPSTDKISAHAPTVLAALGITADDLARLLGGVPDLLTLPNLSALFRNVSLAASLKLSIAEFLSFAAISAIDPFQGAKTADTIRFVRAVQQTRAAGFRIAELDYVLRDHFSRSEGIAPTGARIALFLKELRDGLQKIADGNRPQPDPTGDLTRKQLSALLPPELVEDTFAIVAGTSKLTQAQQGLALTANLDFLASVTTPPDVQKNLVWDPVGTPNAPPDLTAAPDRFGYMLALLRTYVARTQSEALVKQKIGTNLSLDDATVVLLVSDASSGVDASGGGDKALSDFLPRDDDDRANWSASLDKFAADPDGYFANPAAFIAAANAGLPTPIDFTRLQNQLQTFSLLHKVALLSARLNVTVDQLRFLLKGGPALNGGWLDPNQLPPRAITALPFSTWLRMAQVAAVRDAMPGSTVFDLFNRIAAGGTVDDVRKLVTGRTGWRPADLDYVIDILLKLQFAAEYEDERALLRIVAAFDFVRRLGVGAQSIANWSLPDVQPADARDMKNALKAKYDDVAWLTIAKPLQDVLREARRDALVAYLVGTKNVIQRAGDGQPVVFTKPDDLFEYFLIDVQMSACQLTSRIKQAIGSVQLFVQRCLMNLERYPYGDDAGATLQVDATGAKFWKWMKNYRVWEANRRVFLYPENWIEPELRDDKTPFFKDLENQIQQGNITADTAEDAFHNYLEKLDQVARLDVRGVYHEQEGKGNDTIDVQHVFARTIGEPHTYFYRRREVVAQSVSWTPWEKVDLDIQGDHLVPIMWNRRMHLIWPIFKEKAIPQDSISQQDPAPAPKKYWEIQLAMSEYKKGKWLPRRVTKQTLSTVGPNDAYSFWTNANEDVLHRHFGQNDYFFKGRVDADGNLLVACLLRNFGTKRVLVPDPDGRSVDEDLQDGTFIFGAYFMFTGCAGDVIADEMFDYVEDDLLQPKYSRIDAEGFDDLTSGLTLPAGDAADNTRQELVLNRSPISEPAVRVLEPHQYFEFFGQDAFFVQDNHRVFFVEPTLQWTHSIDYRKLAAADPSWILAVAARLTEHVPPPAPTPPGPIL